MEDISAQMSSVHSTLNNVACQLRDTEYKLVVSSSKSEALKGVVSRKGGHMEPDLTVRLNGQKVHIALEQDQEQVALHQAVDCINFIMVAQRTSGDIRVRVGSMLGLVRSARQALRQPNSTKIFPLRPQANEFNLPRNVVVDFYVKDSALVTEVRWLEYEDNSLSSIFSKRRDSIQYGGTRAVVHDHIRVESQDPNLISAITKLSALENQLEAMRRKLDII